MLITFKSPASNDVVMFRNNARELLGILGKHSDDLQGVVTVEQLPAALARVVAAIRSDKEHPRSPANLDSDADGAADASVRLSQRALPMVDLLERSMKEEVPVTWGV